MELITKNNDKTNWYLMWIYGKLKFQLQSKSLLQSLLALYLTSWFSFSPTPTGLGIVRQRESRKHSQTLRSCQTSSLSRYIYTSRDNSHLFLTSHRKMLWWFQELTTHWDPRLVNDTIKDWNEWAKVKDFMILMQSVMFATRFIALVWAADSIYTTDKPTLMKAWTPLRNNYVSPHKNWIKG